MFNDIRPAWDHRTLFSEIGGDLVQNRHLNNNPIDPIFIYIKKQLCQETVFLWPNDTLNLEQANSKGVIRVYESILNLLTMENSLINHL
jgi:hypothetical protein